MKGYFSARSLNVINCLCVLCLVFQDTYTNPLDYKETSQGLQPRMC